nr:alpha/beta hydrolase [Kribbella capetownensis]
MTTHDLPARVDDANADVSDRYDPSVPPPSAGVYDLGDVTRLEVSFPSDGHRLAGHLYLPPTPQRERDGRPPGVVLDGPATSVKEITVPVYAIRLARAGYMVLTFDRRGFGESQGTVRQQMNPPDNVRDIRNATTYLLSRDDVDPERVAGVGVCYGGGFMLQAGALDRRYRAIACIGAAYGSREQMRDDMGHDGWIELMRTLAAQRQVDFEAGRPLAYQAGAPSSSPPGSALLLADEPYDFYTNRQQQIAPSWVNLLTQESMQNMAEYDAIAYAPLVTPTPLLVVHGTVDPVISPRYAQQVHASAGEPKTIVWIETSNHIQIYDIEPYVGQATTALIDWLAKHMLA